MIWSESVLKQQLEMRLSDDPFSYEELQAVVGLLAGPGHVHTSTTRKRVNGDR
ncbi:MAG: hypothetical protein H8E66_34455 [Planctomycetes bacterium]|nr:hypothetical protein [Planctomycetota bacterium]